MRRPVTPTPYLVLVGIPIVAASNRIDDVSTAIRLAGIDASRIEAVRPLPVG